MELSPFMADPESYIRCRPCDCKDGLVQPWDDWEMTNRLAYENLRKAKAPYPVIVVPGYYL